MEGRQIVGIARTAYLVLTLCAIHVAGALRRAIEPYGSSAQNALKGARRGGDVGCDANGIGWVGEIENVGEPEFGVADLVQHAQYDERETNARSRLALFNHIERAVAPIHAV